MKFKIKKDAFDFLKQYEEENVSFIRITTVANTVDIEVIKENNSISYTVPAEVSLVGSVFVVINKLIGIMNLFENDIVFEYSKGDKELLELSGENDNIKISLICWSEMPPAIISSLEAKSDILFEVREGNANFEEHTNTIEDFIKKNNRFGIAFSANKDYYLTNASKAISNNQSIKEVYYSMGTELLSEKIKSGGRIENVFVSPEVLEFKFSDCSIFCKCDIVHNPVIS